MPTTYAHYRFGKDVYKRLPDPAKETIDAFRGLYDIGLHGPDLLFYYRALTKNPINQRGFAMHERPGREFFQAAAPVVNAMTDSAPAMAYLYGFLCHFALDSSCHPYVEQMVRETGISHSAIEAELDRYFMEKDGYDPLSHYPTGHLISCPFHARVIARFFPGIGAREIEKCIRSIRFYCSLLVVPGRIRRGLTYGVMKLGGCPQSIRDMIIRYQKIPDCIPICFRLEELYQDAVVNAAEFIQNFQEYTNGVSVLDKRLEHTFGEF